MAVKVREWKAAWWVFVDFRGRRKAKRVGVGQSGERAARAAAEKIAAKLTLGETAILDERRTRAVTFKDYADGWLKSHVNGRLKPATAEMYEGALRGHWFPTFGATTLSALTREAIKRVLGEKLASGLRSKTVQGRLHVLRACLGAAVEDGLLPANPAARLGKWATRSEDRAVRVETFSREELATLLEVAEREVPSWYPLLLTLARTGLRLGEALTLQRGDLDFTRRELWVRRTWGSRKKALGDRRINAPKANRERRVDMSQQLCRVLAAHLEVQEAEAIVAGRAPSPWVFPDRNGRPILPGAFWQNLWRPLLKRSGLAYRKPHTLRHTFASLLIAQGESLAYVRDQLGHSSIKITVDVYGHLVPGANKAAVDRLDDANAVSDPTGRNLYATAPA